ncbi:hypothetical protein [Massilia horti]|uniref:Secreted protein n=1 Tax=Massilia horti TaxID=2562153 RepID=A0A4Y9T878_9BURK|nr:hypothetical protein [Massilia horti]TFW34007.1 hypothetical protein E4O92_04960 [Massilia horti]
MRESRQQWVRSLALAACLLGAQAQAGESLCQAGEPIVFSCHIGNKTVSLCRPSSAQHELLYRFGTPKKIELAHPGPGARTASPPFETATTPLVGGGVTTVTFRRGQYQYSVYSKTSSNNGTPEFEDGVIVSRNGAPLKTMVCDDGGEGFRERLDWVPKARK